mmetsp:Transcript_101259/g.139827  ORF Transcript_101259/g.139827 Transcript_101259/m.139827 type:complete len:174 (+) Transcript_101259:35-556(+)|eukprot:CAMPEP_0176350468 /NCGR_PEP_ID=MMETSP0126-20121128/9491_1 /TAXON_ID=141414 ORGANISM="Strombidinopsis acuminatum, Strain SPMC142" /NCGR_SAMPLE_ID=MMETSP0126 /ASSEMBLY_ACC=CAM_ASM_000229 /LENGTH=173 /DNA_ID=CAMNT_0017700481 /DNA_START=35 /DNA_END=556 /DNA_ORIENTATION=-
MQPSTTNNKTICKLAAAELTSELSYMQSTCSTQFNEHSIETFGSTCPLDLKAALKQIRSGFESGSEPKLTDEGTSGTYELRSTSNEKLAIFKPIDEEPNAPNNPRGYQACFGSQTCRAGVLSGESTIREVAAYMLDHDNFSGVPQTTMVEVNHPYFDRSAINEDDLAAEDYFD